MCKVLQLQLTLHNDLICKFRCNVAMVERSRNDVNDGVSWRCLQCKGRKTIREGSFFHKSNTLQKWFVLMLCWAREYTQYRMLQKKQMLIEAQL